MGSIVAADRLMGFLGCSPEWPELDQWLQSVGIFDRPHAAIDDPEWDEDEDLASEDACASGAAQRVADMAQAVRAALAWVHDEAALAQARQQAQQFAQAHQGAAQAMVEAMAQWLDRGFEDKKGLKPLQGKRE